VEVYIKLLKNSFFRNFLFASTILNIGRKLSWVALGWFVYQVTGSALAIAIVISSATIAPLLSSILVGGILDQYDRRFVMIFENVLRGIFLSLIPILYWFDILSLWVIVTVVFINGLLSSFTTIGTSSILPEFLNKDDLESGNAVFTMTGQIGYLIGPALGGFSTALLGAPMTLFINVLCFLFAALLYIRIPRSAYHTGLQQKKKSANVIEKLQGFVSDTKEGFQFIFKYKILIMIAMVTFLFNFTYAPLEPMLPIYVDEILNQGPDTLGVMWTFFAIGSFLGALGWVRLGKKFPYSYSLGSVIMLWGIVPTSFSFISNSIIVYVLMFIGGIVYAPYNIVSPTLRQKLVPNAIRGRVFGVYGLIAGLGFPIGVYLGGLLGEYVGVSYTIMTGGCLTILLGLIVAIHPILRIKEVESLGLYKPNTPLNT
jgi:MFS family permease